MERERYRRMRAVLREVDRLEHHNRRLEHSNCTIVLVALWAALHDRPIYWACQPTHWPGDLRPRSLPSQSCMSRRLRTTAVLELIDRFGGALRRHLPDSDVKMIDGRPLPIGGCGKDPDATIGRGSGGFFRGYKLHVIADMQGAIDAWVLLPANVAEQRAAEPLIASMHRRGWLMADTAYDSNRLYDLTDERGVQLMAKPRPQKHGLGNKRHSPARVRVNAYLHSPPGQRLLRHRIVIEQVNGRMGCSSVGLNHLPHHARRLHRVTLWVALKLLILADHQAATRPPIAA